MTDYKIIEGVTLFSDFDIDLFKSGHHFRLYEKLGSHTLTIDGVEGTYFAVWAPNADSVSVIGNFNNWNPKSHPIFNRWDESGIWEGFISNLKKGDIYKYKINSALNNYSAEKADPFAFLSEVPPKSRHS